MRRKRDDNAFLMELLNDPYQIMIVTLIAVERQCVYSNYEWMRTAQILYVGFSSVVVLDADTNVPCVLLSESDPVIFRDLFKPVDQFDDRRFPVIGIHL